MKYLINICLLISFFMIGDTLLTKEPKIEAEPIKVISKPTEKPIDFEALKKQANLQISESFKAIKKEKKELVQSVKNFKSEVKELKGEVRELENSVKELKAENEIVRVDTFYVQVTDTVKVEKARKKKWYKF